MTPAVQRNFLRDRAVVTRTRKRMARRALRGSLTHQLRRDRKSITTLEEWRTRPGRTMVVIYHPLIKFNGNAIAIQTNGRPHVLICEVYVDGGLNVCGRERTRRARMAHWTPGKKYTSRKGTAAALITAAAKATIPASTIATASTATLNHENRHGPRHCRSYICLLHHENPRARPQPRPQPRPQSHHVATTTATRLRKIGSCGHCKHAKK